MRTIVKRSMTAAVLALGATLALGTAVWAAEEMQSGSGFQWSSSIPDAPQRYGPTSPWREGKLDLNMARAPELASLPGMTWEHALAIQDYRDQNGPYGSVDELLKVPDIGRADLDAIRNLVTVAK